MYTLPGKTKMFIHLKDKSKIRHKKRWYVNDLNKNFLVLVNGFHILLRSQCMYMYYLLGHRLMELPISIERKNVLAENTYLLTLDGDIDFQVRNYGTCYEILSLLLNN